MIGQYGTQLKYPLAIVVRVNNHRATSNYKLNSNIAGVATEIKGKIVLGEGY
jgi:hypothetical protein